MRNKQCGRDRLDINGIKCTAHRTPIRTPPANARNKLTQQTSVKVVAHSQLWLNIAALPSGFPFAVAACKVVSQQASDITPAQRGTDEWELFKGCSRRYNWNHVKTQKVLCGGSRNAGTVYIWGRRKRLLFHSVRRYFGCPDRHVGTSASPHHCSLPHLHLSFAQGKLRHHPWEFFKWRLLGRWKREWERNRMEDVFKGRMNLKA